MKQVMERIFMGRILTVLARMGKEWKYATGGNQELVKKTCLSCCGNGIKNHDGLQLCILSIVFNHYSF